MNETEFIAALRKLPLHPGARGLEDDCAVLAIGGETLVLTHDAMAEGTHWLPNADPFDIAWKLVASNLSDLAAKGAEPVGVLLSHTLGKGDARFLEGLSAILTEYGVPLLGGDTIAAKGPRTLGLTAIGRATHTPVPSRHGAQVGDGVFVCGLIGEAMAGFHQLLRVERERETEPQPEFAGDIPKPFAPDPAFVEAFLRPRPLLSEGQRLAPHVTAMMDVSDGLFLDASRMADTSGVTISIIQDAVPHSDRFRERASQGNLVDTQSKGRPMRHTACAWGDDYALLFTARTDVALPIAASRIGEVIEQVDTPLLVDGKPPRMKPGGTLGYQHG
ncbi:thiamine-phosphate kinase [Erythrobacter dokdonensis]|uniref:Thiamine-monophosphate kinase n=1 Tax=Erythrobacter dokdonensis DSW-74 TaxID=1300349 RepID=A0A1A7BG21_9SPHN|nr:thiamine-phosphate kinase [Erythrobacter dokdonensis]OBV11483.1 Thiamine-monophosphate kinase [Erythrobacter dokdonensis DSW-74]